MSRLLLILLLCATAVQTYTILQLETALVERQTMSDTLNTPLTFKKDGVQITTTVTSNRLEGESDEDFVASHADLVEATITNRTNAGWTLVS